MAELVVGEAEHRRRAALVEPVGGERLGQQLLLETRDAREEIPRRRGLVRRRWRRCGACGGVVRRGEGVEHDIVDWRGRTRPAIEAALDDILELAHIAGPAICRELVERRGGEALKYLAAQFARHPACEMLGEQRDVLGALAQRWDSDDVERQAVEEITAEPARLGERR